MNDALRKPWQEDLASLAIDPDVLAKELAAEQLGDPLDDLNPDDPDSALVCDSGLNWLKQGHQERLQGLRVFCEHRDPRAVALLLPLLQESCPVERMSAVYALGRNPSPPALEPLLQLLQADSNAYVRKATAWSLGNYADARVLQPLIHALQNDVAAVRLWATGSVAEAGSTSPGNADIAASQLLMSLRIDAEPVVRSNCIWALGRLYETLEEPRRQELVEEFVNALLNDGEPSVRDEARIALEQLDNQEVMQRLRTLIDEGLLA
ncbi:MAG TPA: HEAT repeat domain-containing protein [Prochlorococcus sp.]|nr:HEAT repeat domain-containing protein [Prochlorococcaceae cyanobacterium Fu_MAG_72]|tara:strand:- start:5143 stop:5937 length:795 start_codon:yes stop_codon:yes gene_type:complete